MRYVIMLQLVSLITLLVLAASAMFSWLQNRSLEESQTLINEFGLANLQQQ